MKTKLVCPSCRVAIVCPRCGENVYQISMSIPVKNKSGGRDDKKSSAEGGSK